MLEKSETLRDIIMISLVRVVFVTLFLILFPCLLLNAIDYKWNVRRKPFYTSKIVQLCNKYPLIYNISQLFLNFPLYENVYRIVPKVSGKVLHVGCGTGLLNRCYKKKYGDAEMVNLDANINMLKYGVKKNAFRSYVHASIYDVPIDDNYFDTIIFARCLHHIRDHKKAFRECSRILRNNGIIIITDPVSLSTYDGMNSYMTNTYIDGLVWRFTKASLRKHIEKRLPQDLRIKSIRYSRLPHITNYNLLYPHTDSVVVIDKLPNS